VGQALLGLLGMGGATATPAVTAGTTAALSAPTLASTYAPALATSAAGPAAQAVATSNAVVASQAAVAGKAALGSTLLKGALSVAPSAISAITGKPTTPKMPKPSTVDLEAAGATERDRIRRANAGARSTILTGPTGAPGRGLVGRTILSGG
jgi:DNA helicase INO80